MVRAYIIWGCAIRKIDLTTIRSRNGLAERKPKPFAKSAYDNVTDGNVADGRRIRPGRPLAFGRSGGMGPTDTVFDVRGGAGKQNDFGLSDWTRPAAIVQVAAAPSLSCSVSQTVRIEDLRRPLRVFRGDGAWAAGACCGAEADGGRAVCGVG